MIRVRYKELSPGLHGHAEPSAHGTVVYLLPGLTGRQRRAALRRLRQEASRGCGPALPGTDLRMALAVDRFRAGWRSMAAVVRLHPAGSLLPTALVASLMALFVLASVSAGVAQPPTPAAPPGYLFSIGGDPTVVGSPALAQAIRHGDPPLIARDGAAGGQGRTAWSLDASTTNAPKPPVLVRRAVRSKPHRSCGPAASQAHGPTGTKGDAAVLAAGVGRQCRPARSSGSPS